MEKDIVSLTLIKENVSVYKNEGNTLAVSMPKGLEIGDYDLSNASLIVTADVREDDKHIYLDYDRYYLDDNNLCLHLKEDRSSMQIEVDIDVLKSNIDKLNEEYVKKQDQEVKKHRLSNQEIILASMLINDDFNF